MSKTSYEKVLEENYEELVCNTEVTIPFEDYRTKVDVCYRINYGLFPQIDPLMMERLKITAVEIGCELNNEAIYEMNKNEESYQKESMKERLLDNLFNYLSWRERFYEVSYPANRRFKRKDIWMLESKEFGGEEIRKSGGFSDAFNQLITEGVIRQIEIGGHHKHDVFEVLMV